jgi:hypothetical protein
MRKSETNVFDKQVWGLTNLQAHRLELLFKASKARQGKWALAQRESRKFDAKHRSVVPMRRRCASEADLANQIFGLVSGWKLSRVCASSVNFVDCRKARAVAESARETELQLPAGGHRRIDSPAFG